MAKVKVVNSQTTLNPMRPALTPESRENQLISLATDLVEKRLRDGSASSQETTHFLKLASSEARLKLKLLETEMELKNAKIKQIEAEARQEQLFKDAIAAMKRYSGHGSDNQEEEDYEYDD